MTKHLALSHLLLVILLASPLTQAPALAKIYTWTDADGNTIFSDQPKEGATEVKLPPPQTWSAADIKPSPPALQPRKKPEPTASYRLLSITQPLHDQSLRANNGEIDITLAIEPTLAVAQGHSISIKLDGKVIISNSSNSQLQLKGVDRGSHQLSATIHDRSGKTLIRSKAVTFHLQRHSILPKKQAPAP